MKNKYRFRFCSFVLIFIAPIFSSCITSYKYVRLESSSQLQQHRTLDAPYRGLSGQAERSLNECEKNKAVYEKSIRPNPNGRSLSFVLNARNKRYASGGFTGPGVACVAVNDVRNADRIFGYILAVYRGGEILEFPKLNRTAKGEIGKTIPEIGLGDVKGRRGGVRLKNIRLQLSITDPPGGGVVIINRH